MAEQTNKTLDVAEGVSQNRASPARQQSAVPSCLGAAFNGNLNAYNQSDLRNIVPVTQSAANTLAAQPDFNEVSNVVWSINQPIFNEFNNAI